MTDVADMRVIHLGKRGVGQRALLAVGIVLIVVWAAWWGVSVARPVPVLVGGERTWMGSITREYLGFDFLHNYTGVWGWFAGENVYTRLKYSPGSATYSYPPMVLGLFAWCRLVGPDRFIELHDMTTGGVAHVVLSVKATLIWIAVIVAAVVWGALEARRGRREIGLGVVPAAFAIGAMLLSFPVVMEMERGNCSALVLLLLLVAFWGLRRKSAAGDGLAGVLLGIAFWVKIYPALMVLGLLGLRRTRAAVVMVVAMVAIGLLTWPWTLAWWRAMHIAMGGYASGVNVHSRFIGPEHSLTGQWPVIWKGLGWDMVARIPGGIGAGLVLLPLALWVTAAVWRSAQREKYLVGYLFWIMALATFWQPVAFDYYLMFLCLAVLAVWDARGAMGWVMLIPVVLWWQPLALPVGYEVLFFCKLLSLGIAGWMVERRLRERVVSSEIRNSQEVGVVPALG